MLKQLQSVLHSASTAGTKVTVDARVLAVTTQHLLLGDSTGKIVVFLGK